jgi:hypothetical protein
VPRTQTQTRHQICIRGSKEYIRAWHTNSHIINKVNEIYLLHNGINLTYVGTILLSQLHPVLFVESGRPSTNKPHGINRLAWEFVRFCFEVGTQYTDVTVVPGQTYFYWVTAVESDTIESTFSDSVMIVIPIP